jgi:hypothetical protein
MNAKQVFQAYVNAKQLFETYVNAKQLFGIHSNALFHASLNLLVEVS